jgi:hypothetical protein
MRTGGPDTDRSAPSQGGDTGSNPVGGATRSSWSEASERVRGFSGFRRWPPNTPQEHRRIVARNLRALHDVDFAKITTHTLDVLYAPSSPPAAARRPNAPARSHHVRSTAPRCRKTCGRPRCPHKGACAEWRPCDDQPCRHSGPLSAARVHRIHTVVRSALGQAVKWGWIRRYRPSGAPPISGRLPTHGVHAAAPNFRRARMVCHPAAPRGRVNRRLIGRLIRRHCCRRHEPGTVDGYGRAMVGASGMLAIVSAAY